MEQRRSARVARVDVSNAIDVAGGLYQPIRRALDVRAFGINAYFAKASGDQLIEKHDEQGAGAGRHAEVYLVHSGHATFLVDGEEIDAPTGTLVFVPDPSVVRQAIAKEPNTSAIVIGGPADRQLPVSPFEFWFVAEQPYQAGDYKRAIEIVSEGLELWPEHPSMLYQLACYHALSGDREQAIEYFRSAAARSPEVKTWQASDRDLDSIRDDPRFLAALAA